VASELPSPSGARLAGDDFQHVFTWLTAMRCLIRGSNVARVEFEVREAGNVDDVVVHHNDGSTIYHQVKFVVDQREPLTYEWFITPSRPGGATPLQRFYNSFTTLGSAGSPPDMVLYTNRATAGSSDPLMRFVGGLDDRLVPRALAQGRDTETGRALTEWSVHLGVDEEELASLLGSLRIRAGEQSVRSLQERCQEVMGMLGLRSDLAAVLTAVGAVRSLIEEGQRCLDRESVTALVEAMGLPSAPPRATLLIQCLAPDPWPDASTVAVNWIQLFIGEEPRSRRQLIDPSGWENRLRPELRTAVADVQAQGYNRVLVTGSYRLSVATVVGAEMPRVAGFHLARRQGSGEEWSSDGPRTRLHLRRSTRDLGSGADIAVAVAIATDLADDVEAYCREALPSVSELVVLSTPDGPGHNALRDASAARGATDALIAGLRAEGRRAATLHLFQAVPSGLSLLMGHAWNRMPETQLYDDLNSPAGYTPTFRLAA
jgi:SMODS-associated and fused to various effectors sensor domain